MNYPDDIRSYDNDPRSPFFDGPECDGTCPTDCPNCGEDGWDEIEIETEDD